MRRCQVGNIALDATKLKSQRLAAQGDGPQTHTHILIRHNNPGPRPKSLGLRYGVGHLDRP